MQFQAFDHIIQAFRKQSRSRPVQSRQNVLANRLDKQVRALNEALEQNKRLEQSARQIKNVSQQLIGMRQVMQKRLEQLLEYGQLQQLKIQRLLRQKKRF